MPVFLVAAGAVLGAAATIGGHPGQGIGMAVILVVAALATWFGRRRSETVQGLLDHGDERINQIDMQATAWAGVAVIVATLIGFVVELALGNSGAPYDYLAALGGGAYLVGVLWRRSRG